MRDKDYIKQLRESMVIAFNNQRKQRDAENKQKPFNTMILMGCVMQIGNN